MRQIFETQKGNVVSRDPRTARAVLMKPRRDTAMPQRPPGLDPIVAEIIEALADCIIWREDCRTCSKTCKKD